MNNYDTGRDHIDIFVVGKMPGALGLAFPPCRLFFGTKAVDPSA